MGPRRRWLWAPASALLLGFSVLGWGADKDDDDLKAINGSADQFTAAFDKGDAKGIAALFAPDAEMVEKDGDVFHGRDAIEKEFAAFFKVFPGAKLTLDLAAVRRVAPNVLVE